MTDATTDPAATPESLAAQLVALNQQIAPLVTKYLNLESQLLKLHAGELMVGETKLHVIPARAGTVGKIDVSYALTPENEGIARQLADKHFEKLFKRVVSFVPVEGFELVTKALLVGAKNQPLKSARELIELCRVETKTGGSSGAAAHIKGIERNWGAKKK
jgi:hypothetical protein